MSGVATCFITFYLLSSGNPLRMPVIFGLCKKSLMSSNVLPSEHFSRFFSYLPLSSLLHYFVEIRCDSVYLRLGIHLCKDM